MTDRLDNETEDTDAYLYRQVERQIRDMVERGALRPGERIPSLRQMSRQARVSLSTVTQAYQSLERHGYVEARPKSGYFVRARPAAGAGLPRPGATTPRPRPVRVQDMVVAVSEAVNSPTILSLGLANPSTENLPVNALARATARVLAEDRARALHYSFAPGVAALREQLAYRLSGMGVRATPDEIIVTNGATEALTVALESVARAGDSIAVESPCYFAVLQIIERLGMLAVEVRTEPGTGLSVEALADTLERTPIKALVVVPNFTNPLGALMPDASKRALVELLAARGIPLIEDDVFGDLHHEGPRPCLAKRFDRDAGVISVGAYSKTLAPGYRVGWMLAGRWHEEALSWKRAMTSESATLPQLAVAEYLRSGHYDRFVREVRLRYRDQVAQVRNLVAAHFPHATRISRPRGGFVLWVELPRGSDGETVFREALAANVSIMPGTLFSPTRRYRNFIRLACGRPITPAVERAVARVGAIAHRVAGETRAGRGA